MSRRYLFLTRRPSAASRRSASAPTVCWRGQAIRARMAAHWGT